MIEVEVLMLCPKCNARESNVVDSRESKDGDYIRRRRECTHCSSRFTTYERWEEEDFYVRKKDQRREKFDRMKMVSGLIKACEKRPVSKDQLDHAAASVEKRLRNMGSEIPVEAIGESLMQVLKDMDQVAYVRFASVYKEFHDVDEFYATLKKLGKGKP